MLQIFFTVVALVAASVHLTFSRSRRSSAARITGTYLVYLFFFYVGVMGLFTAYYHVFLPVESSARIGWSTSPYEYEVGMADLTIGVLGVLCVFFRGEFWLATAVANAVWLLGDAVGHLRDMQARSNHAEYNAGPFLIFEFVVPVLMLALLFYHRRLARTEPVT
jgi:hypothetical protein